MSNGNIHEGPLVSVITVTYNSGAYVRDAIESVLAQTYKNIEYIVGDDCSIDNTWSIICEYKDPRIRAYRNENNIREYPNRNKAIAMAMGKYLIFIDGDDIVYPHGIAYFVTMMEAFPEAAVAIQKNYINNILFPALLTPHEVITNHFFGKYDLLSSSFASNFFRTEVIKKIRLREDLKSGDDEIRLRIASQFPVLFVQGWVSWPRETPGQASSKISHPEQLVTHYFMSLNILNLNESKFDAYFISDVRNQLRRAIARFFLLSILTVKVGSITYIYRHLSHELGTILSNLFYSACNRDVLNNYNSSKPFKRGFLNHLQK